MNRLMCLMLLAAVPFSLAALSVAPQSKDVLVGDGPADDSTRFVLGGGGGYVGARSRIDGRAS